MSVILEARSLRKTFRGGEAADVEVLIDVDLAVHRGEVVAVVGASETMSPLGVTSMTRLRRKSAISVLPVTNRSASRG